MTIRLERGKLPQLRTTVIVGAGALSLQILLGVMSASNPRSGLLIAGFLAGAIAMLRWPWIVWCLALPANFAYWRVGGSSMDLSLADAMLVSATIAALPHVPWRRRSLHYVERVAAAYFLVLAITVVAHPSRIAYISFLQRLVMVLGALFVGAAIGERKKEAVALNTMFAISAFVGAAAVQFSLTHDLEPAFPFGIHKNLVGAVLAAALVVSFVTRAQAKTPTWLLALFQLSMAAGLVASQARGAALSLAAALAVAVYRRPRLLRNPLIIGAIVATSMICFVAFQKVSERSTDRFDSVNSRLVTYDATMKLWRQDRPVGVGIKFWRNPAFAGELGFGEPHSVVVSALGESGVVGLLALTGLLGSVGVFAWRRRGPLWEAAVLVLVVRVVESQFSIFWVANSGSLIWLVVGIAVGAEREEPTRSSSGARAREAHLAAL